MRLSKRFWRWFWMAQIPTGGLAQFRGERWTPFTDFVQRAWVAGYNAGKRDYK